MDRKKERKTIKDRRKRTEERRKKPEEGSKKKEGEGGKKKEGYTMQTVCARNPCNTHPLLRAEGREARSHRFIF